MTGAAPDTGPPSTWLSPFDEFAALHEALASVNCPPPVADLMELWECAQVLGIAPDPPDGSGGRSEADAAAAMRAFADEA